MRMPVKRQRDSVERSALCHQCLKFWFQAAETDHEITNGELLVFIKPKN